MKLFRIKISGNKYPMEYNVEASNWATAIARGIREWQKGKGKGSRTGELRIKATKTSAVIREK